MREYVGGCIGVLEGGGLKRGRLEGGGLVGSGLEGGRLEGDTLGCYLNVSGLAFPKVLVIFTEHSSHTLKASSTLPVDSYTLPKLFCASRVDG